MITRSHAHDGWSCRSLRKTSPSANVFCDFGRCPLVSHPPLDPFQFKTKQAAKLKWKQSGAVSKDGEAAPFTKRCIRFVRGAEEAALWYKQANVTLARLNVPFGFGDFVELEEFLETHPKETDDATDEVKYLCEMELFFIRHGYRDDMMRLQPPITISW